MLNLVETGFVSCHRSAVAVVAIVSNKLTTTKLLNTLQCVIFAAIHTWCLHAVGKYRAGNDEDYDVV